MRSRLFGGLVALSIACGLLQAESRGVPAATPQEPGPAVSACAMLSFGAPIPFSTANTPGQLVTADFNADGIPDLGVGADREVEVRLGTGAGGFGAPSRYLTGPPLALVVADFNGDDAPDLAVVSRGDPLPLSYVSLLLNAGGGTFTQAGPWTILGVRPGLAAGDLDGDGLTDLVVSTMLATTGGVALLHGDGAGGFTPTPAFEVTAGLASGIAIGDVNDDAHPDLAVTVVAGDFSGTIEVRLGDGSGGFGPPTAMPVGTWPRWPQAVDVNGDLFLDLVSVSRDDRTLSILYGDGLGGFAPPVTYAVDGPPSGFAVADLDGDGYTDLAVAGTPGPTTSLPLVHVLLADGAGSFGPPTLYRLFGRASEAIGVVAADFDGDGRPDLAATNGGYQFPALSLLRNMCDRAVDLSLLATGTPSAIRPGRLAQYTMTVANLGPDEAAGVELDVAIPNGIELQAITPAQGRCAWSSQQVECSLGALAAGGTASLTLVVRGGSLGTWTSNVTTSTGGSDPNLADNVANVATVVNLPGGDVLTLTSKADGLAHLSWNPGDAQAGYLIVRLTGGVQTILPGPGTPLPATAVEYTDVTAVQSQDNCYVVAPVDASGHPMARSSMVCMRPGSASATGAPVEFSLKLENNDLASPAWTGPAGQTQSALVRYPLDGSPPHSSLSSGISGFTQVNIQGVATCFVNYPRNDSGWLGNSDLLCAIPGYYIGP